MNVVRAERFELLDKEGNVRVILNEGVNGLVALTLRDKGGRN